MKRFLALFAFVAMAHVLTPSLALASGDDLGFRVVGQVTDSESNPLGRTMVRVNCYRDYSCYGDTDESGGRSDWVMSDDDGNFELKVTSVSDSDLGDKVLNRQRIQILVQGADPGWKDDYTEVLVTLSPADDLATAEPTRANLVLTEKVDSGGGAPTDARGPILAVFSVIALLGLAALAFWLAWKVGEAAERKGRNKTTWFVIAIFFLIPAAIIVAIMKNESPEELERIRQAKPANWREASQVAEKSTTKTCPFCGETILAVAKKCKHCGEFLEPQS